MMWLLLLSLLLLLIPGHISNAIRLDLHRPRRSQAAASADELLSSHILQTVRHSVVRVITIQSEFNWVNPWMSESGNEISGSGGYPPFPVLLSPLEGNLIIFLCCVFLSFLPLPPPNPRILH